MALKGFYFSLDAVLGFFIFTSLMIASFTLFDGSITLNSQPMDEAEAERALMDVSHQIHRLTAEDLGQDEDQSMGSFIASNYQSNEEKVEEAVETLLNDFEGEFILKVIDKDEEIIVDNELEEQVSTETMAIDENSLKPVKIRISRGLK